MLTVRPATLDDAQTLLDWRNDSLARQMSRDTEEIPLETHVAWLSKVLARDDIKLHVVEEDGEPVATIRFDYGDETEFSWSVDPSRRGTGLALEVAKTICRMERDFVGYIKPENIAAQKVCAKAGMIKVEDGDLQKWVGKS